MRSTLGSVNGMSYRRFVALGDSTTEGLVDPHPEGGFRGWADRLAETLAVIEPDLRYANLAVRGKLARQVRAEQLDAALALEPDLASLLSGLNDMLRRNVDVGAVDRRARLHGRRAARRGRGRADVHAARPGADQPARAHGRHARLVRLNAECARSPRRAAPIVVDLAAHPVSSDRRLWSEDRLHANAEGHRRIALAAAQALGLPDADASWTDVFTDPLGRRWPHNHAIWFGRYFTPWLIRRLRGRSSGDGRVAKRPTLDPYT